MVARVAVVVALMTMMVALVIAGTTGKVAGRITNSATGEPLIGVNVLLEGTTLGAATDLDGYYVILNIPPGSYNVVASAIGYTKKIVQGIEVKIDLTTTVHFELAETVVELGEVIEVTAQIPIVRKDLTSSEARVSANEIRNLPVEEVRDVLSLQAGVTVGTGGEIHIRGGRANEVAYWVDGVSVSDGYDRGQAVQVENRALQELQVVSGTFNAEYGQAMSGIVNIVTKDGGSELSGSLSLYGGDYASSATSLYPNIDDLNLLGNFNAEGSLGGPIPFLSGFRFFASGRYHRTDGYLYGYRYFKPDGTVGDSGLVAMNPGERFSAQAKVSYNFSPTMKLSLNGLRSDYEYRDYGHDWKYNPDGDVKKYDRGISYSAIWTHTLSSSSFYTVNGSYIYKRFKEYLYKNPLDSRYVVDPQATNRDLYEFLSAGTNNHQFRRETKSYIGKADYTNQVNRLHQLKAGLEFRYHELFLDDYNLTPIEVSGTGTYVPGIPAVTTPLRTQYNESPIEFSAYLQDKLEYERMIVNVGVRFDYFNSRGKVLADPQDPNVYLPQKPENQGLTLQERLAQWYQDASPKYSVSPRLGISYPITDQGILHFSYGHFLQIPSFIHLYQLSGYKVTTASGLQGVYGNPDLNPEKTIQYEFGLQQQIADDIGFDITAFYRDTRDWVSTSTRIPVRDPETATSYYTIYVNRDYSNIRGITFWINKRRSGFFSFNVAYTFQVAEGNNSNPDEEQAAQQSNQEPTRVLTPLDWDQRHTVNFSLGFGEFDWNATLLGRYGSGLPYTPALNQAEGRGEDASRVLPTNSRRRPPSFSMDLNAYKSFPVGSFNLVLFLRVFNLLDTRNEVIVYGETGRAFASVDILGAAPLNLNPGRINTVEQFILRPDFYSQPREIQLGFEVNF